MAMISQYLMFTFLLLIIPRFMRQDAFNTLNELSNKNSRVNIALGDFNVTSAEDAEANLYGKFNSEWYISHLINVMNV